MKTIQLKTSYGNSLVPLETEFYKDRILFLEGDINQESANDLSKELALLGKKSKEPIKLIINSNGGDVDAGFLIIDAMKGIEAPVSTIVSGRAYSMAAVIFAAGTGERLMLPHSSMMIHQVLVNECRGGNVNEISSLSKTLQLYQNKIDTVLSECGKKNLSQIKKLTSSGKDTYFSPEEAIKNGFCDKVTSMFI